MNWIQGYNLFLFDFDGLLVNTEPVHWKAYSLLLDRYGIGSFWDFEEYCAVAHNASVPLIDIIWSTFAEEEATNPTKEKLYNEKTEICLEIIREEEVDYLPGVEELLLQLDRKGVRRAVVTHSSKELITAVRQRNSLLDTIPHWITREDYGPAKPDPCCYLYAIEKLGQKGDRIIGFEDSPRGLTALAKTPAIPVLVQSKREPSTRKFLSYPTLPPFLFFYRDPSARVSSSKG